MNLTIEKQKLGIIGLLLMWSVTLLIYRIIRVPDGLAVGLLWNLFLAALPLLWAAAFKSSLKGRKWPVAVVFFLLWLLFLPNAPYLLTDMIHLGPRPGIPLWYLLAMLLSCAATGTLLGYAALQDVHATVEQQFGRVMGWVVAVGSLILSGFGIYLGRFLRWNSWDAFTNPLEFARVVVGQFFNSGPHPHPLEVTVVFWGEFDYWLHRLTGHGYATEGPIEKQKGEWD